MKIRIDVLIQTMSGNALRRAAEARSERTKGEMIAANAPKEIVRAFPIEARVPFPRAADAKIAAIRWSSSWRS